MKALGKGFLTAIFWLAVWQCAHMAVDNSLLVPSPAQVAVKLAELAGERSFWLSSVMSLCRVVTGFLLGAAAGAVLAVLTGISSAADALLRPLIAVIRATPVASFIILALVWLKSGHIPSFTAMLIVLPLVWANVTKGIAAMDRGLLEMTEAFGMRPWAKLTGLWAPMVRPYFDAAAVTGLGMAWKAGIAAEVIVSARDSIGAAISDSKVYLDIPGLFAWTLVVIALSMLLEKLLEAVTKRKGGAAGAEL